MELLTTPHPPTPRECTPHYCVSTVITATTQPRWKPWVFREALKSFFLMLRGKAFQKGEHMNKESIKIKKRFLFVLFFKDLNQICTPHSCAHDSSLHLQPVEDDRQCQRQNTVFNIITSSDHGIARSCIVIYKNTSQHFKSMNLVILNKLRIPTCH